MSQDAVQVGEVTLSLIVILIFFSVHAAYSIDIPYGGNHDSSHSANDDQDACSVE